MKTIPERTQWWCTVFPYWSIPVSYTHLDVYKRQGLFFGQQLQSRHHGEAGVIIADSQYAAVLLGDGSHLQKAEAVAAGILLCGA